MSLAWQVRLDASQSAAVAELEQRLKDEDEVLSSLQQNAVQQLEMNNQRECRELDQKIEIRRMLLDQKVMPSVFTNCQMLDFCAA